MTTPYHAKYWAHQLTLDRAHDGTNVDAIEVDLAVVTAHAEVR